MPPFCARRKMRALSVLAGLCCAWLPRAVTPLFVPACAMRGVPGASNSFVVGSAARTRNCTDGVGGVTTANQPLSGAYLPSASAPAFFFSDSRGNTVRAVDTRLAPTYFVSTVAGECGVRDYVDGVGQAARFAGPAGADFCAADDFVLYVRSVGVPCAPMRAYAHPPTHPPPLHRLQMAPPMSYAL